MSSKHKNKNFIPKKSNLQFENKRIFVKIIITIILTIRRRICLMINS
jgi:hypothetical protein